MTPDRSHNLDLVLLEAIDSAMEVLGTTVKESILLYLAKTHSMHKQDIPADMKQFSSAMRNLLGYGAHVVEKLVIASLVVRCHIPPSAVHGKTLNEVIEIADRSLGGVSTGTSEGELEDATTSRKLGASTHD